MFCDLKNEKPHFTFPAESFFSCNFIGIVDIFLRPATWDLGSSLIRIYTYNLSVFSCFSAIL